MTEFTPEPGWLNRQAGNVEREVTQWPDSMKRAAGIDPATNPHPLSTRVTELEAQLAEVTVERDLLRAALIECAVPLEVLHAIDCDLAPATQAGITAAVTAMRAALFSAQPEPKPEAPKCEKCGGTGWVEDTSGYVDFMMCQVCRMHQKKNNI